ncbi:MAG: Eco57I restriction-modification methylase domain-containing protein [Candidatus Methylumidiphilus sp.]
MNYPSIRIEGAILSPDILEGLHDDTVGQRPADFGLEANAKVKDEIARAWADAKDYWRIFHRKLDTLKTDSPATSETRNLWMVPLFGLLGYQLEYQAKAAELNGKNYPISHRVVNRANTPVHIIGYREAAGLDRKPERTYMGASRMSAHGLVQEYLNLHDELFGLVTNGRMLRLLRDSSRLIKLTYLEFDLDRIFTDGLFADFAVLYRLLHATRLPIGQDSSAESLLERYHQDSLDSGARIRAGLSKAVEQAIKDFANGFLTHPHNDALREQVSTGKLTAENYYRYLLHLIYRLLFLMVIEERNLVFPGNAQANYRTLYQHYYSLQRLRRLAEKRHIADHRHHDLWLSLLSTFQLFESEATAHKLGMKPLAGDLFSQRAINILGQSSLANDVLLGCLRSLSLYQHPDNGQLLRVNYAALNVEEFGSVYEGLLEYRPVFLGARASGSPAGGTPALPEFAFAQGDQRAATGSHYTPDELVQPLIKHSLDYLIADKLKESNPEQALLSLRVADIACGSGHILLAAARRIAIELAIVRTGEEQPSPPAIRTATRDVIKNCIYGVDLNPLAVELCKVALWLEAHNPGEPLNFLDHHIKCGNSIVGFAKREELERGIPDEAFASQPTDEKDIAALFRKKNKKERENPGQFQVFDPVIEQQLDAIINRWQELSGLPEHTPAQIDTKKQRFQEFSQSQDAWTLAEIAAMPIAQFYIEKTNANRHKLMTDAEYRRYLTGQQTAQGLAVGEALAIAETKRFFHWFLEFPDIFSGERRMAGGEWKESHGHSPLATYRSPSGGFDCILGNPPYLGGQALSGTYGHPFCSFVKWEYEPAGLSDLVAYFLRRIFSLLRPNGFTAFITTNSIKDGDIRKDGLEQVIAQGGSINMAVRGIKWPGLANLVVSIVVIHKGKWQGMCSLDNQPAAMINAFFEDSENTGDPITLIDNADFVFMGSIPLGDGFFLSQYEAESYLINKSYITEIQPLLNGQEVNSHPEQKPSRYVINLEHYISFYKAEGSCPELIDRLRRLVLPERLAQKNTGAKENWWRYYRHNNLSYKKSNQLGGCFITAATTKYLNFSWIKSGHIFTHALFTFTTDRWDLYSIVQSTIHEVWARKYSGALETRLRYSPSDCFETFPFPEGLWKTANPFLADIGEHYHEHRRTLMRQLWLGLTDIYNLVHTRDLTPERVAKLKKSPPTPLLQRGEREARGGFPAEADYQGILELRRLHVELDNAIRDAYGWQDLDLGHDFHEVETLPENDRIRYTISPAARKEVLKRLLAENHRRAAEQAASAATKPKSTRGKKAKTNENQGEIFS